MKNINELSMVQEQLSKYVKMYRNKQAECDELKNEIVYRDAEIERLKDKNKSVSTSYVKLLINYLEMLDEHEPEWRLFAENEIKQLRELLEK